MHRPAPAAGPGDYNARGGRVPPLRMRRVPLVLLALLAAAILAVRVGLPWYVNSGRARLVLLAALHERVDADVTLGRVTMPRWLVLAIDEVAIRVPSAGALTVRELEMRATIFGLLRRRIHEVQVARVEIALPPTLATAQLPFRPSTRDSRTQPPTIERLRLPEIVVSRDRGGTQNPFAIFHMDAHHAGREAYDVDVEGRLPALDLEVEGAGRYRPGQPLPEAGTLSFGADYARVLQEAGITGLAGEGRVEGTLTLDGSVARIDLRQPGLHWGSADIGPGEVRLAAPVNDLSRPLAVDTTVALEQVRLGDRPVAPGAVVLRGGVQVDVTARRIAWEDVQVDWAPGIMLQSTGDLAVGGLSAGGHAEIQLPRRLLADVVGALPPLDAPLGGTAVLPGDVNITVTGALAAGRPALTARAEWHGAGFAATEFHQAAGFDLALEAQARPDAATGGGWLLEASGTLTGGEILWDAFYHDFGDQVVPLEATGRVSADGAQLTVADAKADFAGFGRWRVEGQVPLGAPSLRGLTVTAVDIQLADVVRDVATPLLAESRPWAEALSGRGTATFDAQLDRTAGGALVTGRLRLADAYVDGPEDGFSVHGLDADVPFRLGPGAVPSPAAPPEAGRVRFAGLQAGPVALDGADLPLQVWDNAVIVGAPYRTVLFDGAVTVEGIRGRGLLTADREWEAAVRVEALDLAQASAAFRTIVLDGRLGGQFDRVHFARDTLDADGMMDGTIYGGAFHLTRFGIRHLTSPYRTYLADVSWTGIDLAQASAALNVGAITGVLDGRIRGLQVQAGQPAAFEAEFHTVPTPGVPQTISIDAVNNISVLGTGRGMSGMLSRGLQSFFDEYKYTHIGFICSLERDQFYMGGGLLGPEGEYFVKGTFLPPRINVIRRDPTGTISFTEMVRRVQSLDLATAGDLVAPAKGNGP